MFTYKENGSVTDVGGFQASGIHSGLRAYKKDLALIYSEVGCNVAGVYTQNAIKAAPLEITESITKKGKKVNAVLINSKCANACTGQQGYVNAVTCQEELAKTLNIRKEAVLLSSTGVIGEQLPVDKIVHAMPELVNSLSLNGGLDAAEAILTTDTKIKTYSMELELSSGTVKLGAICKGSGMIHPNMATMLGFITTDALLAGSQLKFLLKKAVQQSFNKISVDSETSTNDMVLLLANGVSKIEVEIDSKDEKLFYEALVSLCKTMAKSIVSDGEGASKLVTISIAGALSEADANKVAKSIATSPLVKTALYGEDPNWGRIIAAIGYSGANLNPEKISISLGDHTVLAPDYTIQLDEVLAKNILSENEVTIHVDLNLGRSESTWWTCDFSKEYVSINSDYRS